MHKGSFCSIMFGSRMGGDSIIMFSDSLSVNSSDVQNINTKRPFKHKNKIGLCNDGYQTKNDNGVAFICKRIL